MRGRPCGPNLGSHTNEEVTLGGKIGGCRRLGVQIVVDNHTIDDSLRREGWDVTKRSMRGQGPVTVRQLARPALNYVRVL